MQIHMYNTFYSGVVRELNKNAKNQVTEEVTRWPGHARIINIPVEYA